jgi:hypothetical protein
METTMMNISLNPWQLAQLDARAKLLARSLKEDVEIILQNAAARWSWCTPGALDQYVHEAFLHELSLHIDDIEIERFQGKLSGVDQFKRLAELEKELEFSLQWVKRLQAEYEHKPTKPKLTLVKPEPVT